MSIVAEALIWSQLAHVPTTPPAKPVEFDERTSGRRRNEMSIHLSHPWDRGSRGRYGRRLAAAFTLVEMLVAMAVTLILIAALAQAYAIVGDVVAEGRSVIELSGNLRAIAHRLQEDLERVTLPVRPWADDSGAGGYFEYFDGPSTDKDWNADGTYDTDPTASDTTRGDVDDVLLFTSRSDDALFSGIVNGVREYSPLGEVVWWIQEVNGRRVVYRRVLLIRPELGRVYPAAQPYATYANNSVGYSLLRQAVADFFRNNDLSVRVYWELWDNPSPPTPPSLVDLQTHANINDPTHSVRVQFIANSLAELTRRENRFAHLHPFPNWQDGDQLSPPRNLPPFPFALNLDPATVDSVYRMARPQDIVVSDALTFDAQAYDPTARLYYESTPGSDPPPQVLVPSDPGYVGAASSLPIAGYGAFVDLGYGTRESGFNAWNWSIFSGNPHSRSRLSTYSYCTWSAHYERDGANQDDDSNSQNGWENLDYYQGQPRDEGNDGVDNDGQNGVDDVAERETSPPYPSPLSGIRVRIRAWDPDSRQVRQASVIQDFIPE
jgi:type II secretory pathway pseudopilin PulG